MYTPSVFAADGASLLAAIIEETPLAALVTTGPEGLVATHLPMMFQEKEGRLLAHMARANPHWQALADREALAIFVGHQGYISPSWYASKQEHAKVVPTWNYEAVHVYGRVSLIEDTEGLLELITQLTEQQEVGRTPSWAVSDAPERFVASQMKAIIGLSMAIDRIEGKRKLSQNRPEKDRLSTIAGLNADKSASARALGDVMKRLEEEKN